MARPDRRRAIAAHQAAIEVAGCVQAHGRRCNSVRSMASPFAPDASARFGARVIARCCRGGQSGEVEPRIRSHDVSRPGKQMIGCNYTASHHHDPRATERAHSQGLPDQCHDLVAESPRVDHLAVSRLVASPNQVRGPMNTISVQRGPRPSKQSCGLPSICTPARQTAGAVRATETPFGSSAATGQGRSASAAPSRPIP